MKKSELKQLIKESLLGLTGYVDIKPYSFYEAKVNSKEEFIQYTYKTLKTAHGDKYDQKIADKMIKDLTNKYGNDWPTMVGVVKQSLYENRIIKEGSDNIYFNKYRNKTIDKPIIPDAVEVLSKNKDAKKFTNKSDFLKFSKQQKYFSASESHCFYSEEEYDNFSKTNKKDKDSNNSYLLFDTGRRLVQVWDDKNKIGYIIPSEIKESKELELRKIIKEEIEKLKENKLVDDIYKNKNKKIEISLKYARIAQEVFKDQFQKYGKMEYSNTYIFKKSDYLVSFVESLIQAKIPQDELTVS